MKSNIAFLVFAPSKQRRKDNSFDGNDNIGAYVIREVLEKAGHQIRFCAPETAKNFKVVLVSLTSTYDVFAFYQAVALRPEWQRGKRQFKVICGGFGLQNPYPVRNFVDYGVFGRGESIAQMVVEKALDGDLCEHESVMNLPEITPVKISQSQTLYDGECFKEEFIGCSEKCLFCHYTWARKPLGISGSYVQNTLTGGNSPEVLLKDLPKINHKCGRLRTAIDGFSERLRFAFGKHISNDDIIRGFEHIGSFKGNTVAIVYNIGNFPTEKQQDRIELDSVLRKISPKHRVIIVLHTTPFRPSLATPMQFAEVSLTPSYTNFRFQTVIDNDHLLVKHSMSNESQYSHLRSVIAERATEKTDKLFHSLCFSKKLNNLKSSLAVSALRKNFDVSPYLKSYEMGEHPGWFLNTYTSTEKMFNLYRQRRNAC